MGNKFFSFLLFWSVVAVTASAFAALSSPKYILRKCFLDQDNCNKKIDERKHIDGRLLLKEFQEKTKISIKKNSYTQTTPLGLESVVEISVDDHVIKYLKKDGTLLSDCRQATDESVECLELAESEE